MRSEVEIQKAHDLLVAYQTGELPQPDCAGTRLAIHAATDVLCWVLNHEHNKAFEFNLTRLQGLVDEARRRN